MTAKIVNPGERLLEKLQVLVPERQQQLLDFAEFLVQQQAQVETVQRAVQNIEENTEASSIQKQRVFGLHAGQVWMSEDFDAPLPDEFWLGENDPLMMTNDQVQGNNLRSMNP